MPPLKGPRLAVVVVAQLRSDNDVFAQAKLQSCRYRCVEAGEARALAIEIVERLHAEDAAQARRKRKAEIVTDRRPVSGAGAVRVRANNTAAHIGGHIGLPGEHAFV